MVIDSRNESHRAGNHHLRRLSVPRYVTHDWLIQPNGSRLRRLKIILMSNGCSVPTCTMCPFTNENNYGHRDILDHAMVDQVRAALAEAQSGQRHECVALYNDGSFFAPRELSDHARVSIAALAAAHDFSLLTVESLPQFITEARLLPVLDAMGEVQLEVGLGLQSAHPLVRELCVNTSFDNAAFERAVALLLRHRVRVKTYVMLKPPFLTEQEAVTDAVDSVAYCRDLGIPYVTLCPTRVAPHTLAWDLMRAGFYEPPGLWSIVDTVRRASRDTTLRVACINLRNEDFDSVFPHSCQRCAGDVINALQMFSIGDARALTLARCGCAPDEIEPALLPEPDDLLKRIRTTLDSLPARASVEPASVTTSATDTSGQGSPT
ncbi:MAG: hypothetical protein ACLGP3_08190 [Acidobacteriota bacterium]|jgi:radical SAM enzyme (TIGR01210 family)